MRVLIRSGILILLALHFQCGREGSKSEKAVNSPVSAEQKMADKMIENLKTSNFDQAIMLFHFPSSYSKSELNEDRSKVKRNLATLRNEFGAISNVKPLTGPVVYYQVGIAGATVPYWQQHRQHIKYEYSAHFSKQGSGYIAVEICNISKVPEVRFLYYALPAWNPLAKERIALILGKLVAKRGA